MRTENRNNQIVYMFNDVRVGAHYEVLELVLGRYLFYESVILKRLLKLLGLTVAKYSSI